MLSCLFLSGLLLRDGVFQDAKGKTPVDTAQRFGSGPSFPILQLLKGLFDMHVSP